MNSDRRTPAARRKPLIDMHRSGMAAFVACGLFVGGCGQPTETTRDNRRLLDAILTAVTIHSRDELAKDKKRLDDRLQAKLISAESHSAIRQIMDQAEAGDWPAAERQLYQFRERAPFPK